MRRSTPRRLLALVDGIESCEQTNFRGVSLSQPDIADARSARVPLPDFSRAQAEVLAADLRATITGEVRFDDGTRALYAVDGSNYRQVPIGVVIPRTIDEVVQTVAWRGSTVRLYCRAAAAPACADNRATSL